MATGVSNRNPLFDRNNFLWRSVRDALEGMNAVKRAGEIYLPMPIGFLEHSNAPSIISSKGGRDTEQQDYIQQNSPFYHENPAYMGYLQRARFPEITQNTLRGLMGVVQRKELEIKLSSRLSYLEKKATKKNQTIEELFILLLSEVLSAGRVSIVVDVDVEENKAYLVPYKTETFINWDDDEETGLTNFAVFEEKSLVQDTVEFETKEVVTHLVFSKMIHEEQATEDAATEEDKAVIQERNDRLRNFIGKEVVTVRHYLDSEEIPEMRSIPNVQGTPFEELPVVSICAIENKNDPSPIPLLGVSEIAYSVYRKDADHKNAIFMTCNPMFTISGAQNEEGVAVNFGSTGALLLANPEAKAYFPETDTSALDHVRVTQRDDLEEAANYGVSLLGPTKKGVESTDTTKMRQSAQGATLVTAVENTIKGINDALKIVSQVMGDSQESSVDLSTDFSELLLSPEMMKALVFSWQAGVYSKESLVTKFIEAGFAEGDVDDELARIFGEGPTQNNDNEDENDDPLNDDESGVKEENSSKKDEKDDSQKSGATSE